MCFKMRAYKQVEAFVRYQERRGGLCVLFGIHQIRDAGCLHRNHSAINPKVSDSLIAWTVTTIKHAETMRHISAETTG